MDRSGRRNRGASLGKNAPSRSAAGRRFPALPRASPRVARGSPLGIVATKYVVTASSSSRLDFSDPNGRDRVEIERTEKGSSSSGRVTGGDVPLHIPNADMARQKWVQVMCRQCLLLRRQERERKPRHLSEFLRIVEESPIRTVELRSRAKSGSLAAARTKSPAVPTRGI
jgi:hypothetical protein